VLEVVPFPGGPWDVPDEIGNGRPLIVVLSYEGCTVGASVEAVPDLIARIYERKGAEGGSLRQLRNNLVFIVADESRIEEMRRKMARRLALNELKKPERIAELAEHQQAKVRELEGKSEAEVAISRELDQWTRRRLRAIAWKQWKRGRTRFAELTRRGVGRDLAACTAGSPHGPWRLSQSPALTLAFPNLALVALGLPSLAPAKPLNPPNRRVRTRMPGGVGGAAP
jgi:hypothetical protein